MSLYEQGSDWLKKLGDAQQMSSPDGRIKKRIEAEQEAIRQGLKEKGEYTLDVDGYVIKITGRKSGEQADGQ